MWRPGIAIPSSMFDECSDSIARRSPDPQPPRKWEEDDRRRLSGPLSGRGYAPPYDRARQPILPAITIVAAQMASAQGATLASAKIAPPSLPTQIALGSCDTSHACDATCVFPRTTTGSNSLYRPSLRNGEPCPPSATEKELGYVSINCRADHSTAGDF
jgi:hypothetical protein